MTNILLYRYFVPGWSNAQLDALCAKVQEAQSLAGVSFVSRTRVRDRRNGASGEEKITCFRCVLGNHHLTLPDLRSMLEEQRALATSFIAGKGATATPSTIGTTLASRSSKDASVRLLHEAALAHAPNSVAVRCAGESWTFKQLAAYARTVAAQLRSPQGSVVAVLADRGCALYGCMLGIMQVGCVYLGIDETLPRQRIGYLLEESGAKELLLQESRRPKLPPSVTLQPTLRILSIDTLPKSTEPDRFDPTQRTLKGDPDAYMIFTSGSTGKPKSVKISHGQLLALCAAFRDSWRCRMQPGDTALACIAAAWDMHLLDVFVALMQGATVQILTESERLGGERLTCIPSGEPLTPQLARMLLARAATVVNCYGLTEGTIFQSFSMPRMGPDPEKLPEVSCGHLAYSDSNYGRLYILKDGKALDARTPDVVGEVALAGAMLPRHGYGHAALDAEKFVPNPTGWVCTAAEGYGRTHLMRTGDLGKFNADGNLVVLGRLDEQVKLHGSRMDLREIEDAVVATTLATACSVKVQDGSVVAYFVPSAAASEKAMEAPSMEDAEEVEIWESIYDDAYAKKDACSYTSAEDLITNWSAYISSYSAKLWPRDVIHLWVNATVDRFLDHAPKRVLEHGCGNGMLLYRAALHPGVEEVWGADLSGEATAYLEEVRNSPHFAHIKDKVKALHRPADNFDGVPTNHFDAIVLSAMIMYFPNMAYVSDVMRKSAAALRDGGCVYVGDCRSLEHTQHFHTDVCLFNAQDDDAVRDLLVACRQRSAKEKEILISPLYWYHHAELLPGCYDYATCLIRRGRDCGQGSISGDGVSNTCAHPHYTSGDPVEMTRFRYDAYLWKKGAFTRVGAHDTRGGPTSPRTKPVVLLPYEGRETLAEAQKRMDKEIVLVQGIPNPRVLDAVAAEELMPQMLY